MVKPEVPDTKSTGATCASNKDKILRTDKNQTAIFDPKAEELITDENKILATTLKYNIGVLTKNKVTDQDLPEVQKKKRKNHLEIIEHKTKGEPLSLKTYKAVLKHIKN